MSSHRLLHTCLVVVMLLGVLPGPPTATATPGAVPPPTIHLPYAPGAVDMTHMAIHWFGQVGMAANYADVRVGFNDTYLAVTMHIFDRRLWYDENVTEGEELTGWDAVSLYVDTDGAATGAVGTTSYRFDAQLSHWQGRDRYQRSFRGQGGAMLEAAIPFTTTTGYRGVMNDPVDDRGWLAQFQVPFTSLELSARPTDASRWRVGIALHDNDNDGAVPDQVWPAAFTPQDRAAWGVYHFGPAIFTSPTGTVSGSVEVKHAVDGAVVSDGHVGGHSICGADTPDYFADWGNANFAGYAQINIQNQWDVADWPCFSRYYVTFPLDKLPAGKTISAAQVTLYMFGNPGYNAGDAKPSFIQVGSIAEAWSEESLTWNNAPPLHEVIDARLVDPPGFYAEPPIPVTWNVSRAVADAYVSGTPLRLVLYSTDGDYHSGKYFWSSDAGADRRPKLEVTWVEAAPATDHLYLPLMRAVGAAPAAEAAP